MKNKSLVSIIIYNYNYGRYLRQCFDSVFNQTYKNIEICFSDNASIDDSWDIAFEYMKKYPGQMTITRNKKNCGAAANIKNCQINAKGKYLLYLASDDYLHPKYIETCVKKFLLYPETGFIMVNRFIVDENENIIKEKPFYDNSYIIPGKSQAAVYMMAPVNPSISQIIYNVEKTKIQSENSIVSRWLGSRITDFLICLEYDIIYIKDSFLYQRIHLQSDTSQINDNLIQIMSSYLIQHQFAEIADDIKEIKERLYPSIKKLSELCLRYSLKYLIANNIRIAMQYINLSKAIYPEIIENKNYKHLIESWDNPDKLKNTPNFIERKISYPPPPGSKRI